MAPLMVGNRWTWRTLLVVLLVAATAFVFPVMAQSGEPATPLNETLTWTLPPTPPETQEETPDEAPTWTLTPTPPETQEETPEETLEEALNETAEPVAPWDTIQVTDEPQVYDFSGLRNATASSDADESAPVIELRTYEDDDPGSGGLAGTVSLGATDTSVELEASDFNGIYGTYYPYDGETVIDKPITVEGPSGVGETANATEASSSGVVAETTTNDTIVSNETANETDEPPTTSGTGEVTTETTLVETSTAEMPTFTPMMEAEVNPDQTQVAPLSLQGAVVGLLAAAGVFLVMRRK
jgi:hypothetical protein